MFTGIVEHLGTIESLSIHSDGGSVRINAPTVAASLAVSNSIAVNGCCLTVVSLENERFSADLSGETIRRTSFGAEKDGRRPGTKVNLEQPLTAGKEFGGHFVLGHIDGISLTVANWNRRVVEVAVIPYTYEHTNLRDRKPGDAVNLEGDILGKYIERHLEARNAVRETPSTVTIARLVEEGF